jgi:hypothetical protein
MTDAGALMSGHVVSAFRRTESVRLTPDITKDS